MGRALALATGLLGVVNAGLPALLTRSMVQAIWLLLVLVGGGTLILDTPALAVTYAGVALTWAAVTASVPLTAHWSLRSKRY